MSNFAQRIAEAIFINAQSGSAVWDELNGPDAEVTTKPGSAKHTIVIPQGYDENDEPTKNVCLITVEEVMLP